MGWTSLYLVSWLLCVVSGWASWRFLTTWLPWNSLTTGSRASVPVNEEAAASAFLK